MSEISIVVIDDHPLFRQGVVDALSLEPDLKVIGQSSNGEDGLDLIREIQPQVAIVDINLPGMNGQQVTRGIVSERLPTRVILLTAYDDAEQKIYAMRAGASAYDTKDIQPEELVEMIRLVAGGMFVFRGQYFTRTQMENWIKTQSETAMRLYSDPVEPFQPLSSREMKVLTYISQGFCNKEIAALMDISHQTVKNYVTTILRKLNVEDRTQAVIFALRYGWVRLHDQNIKSEE